MTSSEFKAARLTLGLTQVEMARALGYSNKGSVWEIESDRSRPRPGAVLLIEAYLSGYRPAIWPPVGKKRSASKTPANGQAPAADRAPASHGT